MYMYVFNAPSFPPDASTPTHYLLWQISTMPPGRVRPTHMVSTEMEHQSTVLSLSVFPPHYQKVPGDDRYR